jgi:outer membrane protein TolC
MIFAGAGHVRSAGAQEPLAPPPLPADPVPQDEPGAPGLLEEIGPAPGAATLSLAQAVATALSGNFGLISSAESVQAARLRYRSAVAQFYPQLTPRYLHGEDERTFAVDASQKLPWTGGSVTANSALRTRPEDVSPAPRSADFILTLTQPLLRGVGPNATFFNLRNSRRSRAASERGLELARQQVAVEVTRAFYQVLQQRMLMAVAQQSLARSESLLRASEARLQVGLVSKLDVFRAQLRASQTQDAMVRAEAALQGALERFRGLLGRAPGEPIEPEATRVPEEVRNDTEPLAILVQRALEQRLDLREARDQVDDAQRSASLARQDLLPQVDFNLGVARVGQGPSFGSAWRAADTRVNVFLTASYPLEHSTLAVNKAVADIEVAARTRAVVQREWEVEAEVRASVRDLEQIRKSVDLQKAAVEIAAQQLRLSTLRYQRGLASNFDVVDAESNLVLARSTLVGLLTSYQVARVDLMRVTGSLDVAAEFSAGAGQGPGVP